jgi:hypothetical protein
MSLEDDRNTFKKFLREKSFLERWLPVVFEQLKIWGTFANQSEKLLPDYCYNIFAIYRRTYFKAIPTVGESVSVTDKEKLMACKSVEEAKQFVKIKFRHLGKAVGVTIRGVRFFDLEAERHLEKEGLLSLPADEVAEVNELVFGRHYWRPVKAFFKSQKIGHGTKRIRKYFSTLFLAGTGVSPNFQELAYQWGPEAMIEFQAGLAEGMAGVLDENGRLAGESLRANIYNFLLLAWPEIKEMLESNPRKTITHLHNWMTPFMRLGVVNYVDLDYLRDVCAPPSQSGIGLQLRPMSSRPPRLSA